MDAPCQLEDRNDDNRPVDGDSLPTNHPDVDRQSDEGQDASTESVEPADGDDHGEGRSVEERACMPRLSSQNTEVADITRNSPNDAGQAEVSRSPAGSEENDRRTATPGPKRPRAPRHMRHSRGSDSGEEPGQAQVPETGAVTQPESLNGNMDTQASSRGGSSGNESCKSAGERSHLTNLPNPGSGEQDSVPMTAERAPIGHQQSDEKAAAVVGQTGSDSSVPGTSGPVQEPREEPEEGHSIIPDCDTPGMRQAMDKSPPALGATTTAVTAPLDQTTPDGISNSPSINNNNNPESRTCNSDMDVTSDTHMSQKMREASSGTSSRDEQEGQGSSPPSSGHQPTRPETDVQGKAAPQTPHTDAIYLGKLQAPVADTTDLSPAPADASMEASNVYRGSTSAPTESQGDGVSVTRPLSATKKTEVAAATTDGAGQAQPSQPTISIVGTSGGPTGPAPPIPDHIGGLHLAGANQPPEVCQAVGEPLPGRIVAAIGEDEDGIPRRMSGETEASDDRSSVSRCSVFTSELKAYGLMKEGDDTAKTAAATQNIHSAQQPTHAGTGAAGEKSSGTAVTSVNHALHVAPNAARDSSGTIQLPEHQRADLMPGETGVTYPGGGPKPHTGINTMSQLASAELWEHEQMSLYNKELAQRESQSAALQAEVVERTTQIDAMRTMQYVQSMTLDSIQKDMELIMKQADDFLLEIEEAEKRMTCRLTQLKEMEHFKAQFQTLKIERHKLEGSLEELKIRRDSAEAENSRAKQRCELVDARVKETTEAEETRQEQIRELQIRVTKSTSKLRRAEKDKQRAQRKLNDHDIGAGSVTETAEEEVNNKPSPSCSFI